MSRTMSVLLSALLLLVVGGAVGAHLRMARPGRPIPSAAPAAPPPTPQPANSVVAELRGTTLVVRRQGEKQLEVHADRVSVSADLRQATFAGIARAALYQDGRLALQLRAAEITLDRHSNDLRLAGPLEITSGERYRLRSPGAAWVAARRQLMFPAGVEVEAAGSTIRAARLTVDLSSQVLLLEGGVDVTFPIPGGAP